MTMPEADKKKVIAFHEMLFNDCDPAGAIAHYVGEEAGDKTSVWFDKVQAQARFHARV